jgi:hypothetical protein
LGEDEPKSTILFSLDCFNAKPESTQRR